MLPRLSPPFDLSDIFAMLAGWVQEDGVQQFEKEFAMHCGVDYALAFPYCRSAFYSFIKVMGWTRREIILPAYTCASMPATVVASGNVPRFVDIEPESFNMDSHQVEMSIVSNTAAVVATHMYGVPMDLIPLTKKLKNKQNISVLQDFALAIGMKPEKTSLGSQSVAFYSFSLGKHISTGEGGMIVTNDRYLYLSLREHRNREYYAPGFKSDLKRTFFIVNAMIGTNPALYSLVYFLEAKTSLLDFLTKPVKNGSIDQPADMYENMSSVTGYLGKNQVGKIDSIIVRKRDIAAQYYNALSQLTCIKIQKPTPDATYSHFPCLVENRNDFVRYMEKQGINIGTEVFDYVAPSLKAFKQYATGEYANSEYVANRLVLLPNYYGMSENEVQKVIQGVTLWTDLY